MNSDKSYNRKSLNSSKSSNNNNVNDKVGNCKNLGESMKNGYVIHNLEIEHLFSKL